MARFLSHDWVDAFNRALEGVDLPGPEDGAGLAVADGPVVVAEDVQGGPDGDVRLLLHIGDGSLRLELAGEPSPSDGTGSGRAQDAIRDPDVTIVLGYGDAVALSRGQLSPAEALNEGRVRVRGDLAVLVEGQRMLAAARLATGDLTASTTY